MDKKCEQCGEPFQSKRQDARFCGGKCRIASVRGKPKFDENAEARAALKKRVKVAKVPKVEEVGAAAVFALMKSKLPSSAPVLPRGVPIVQPSKKKAQPKGGES